MKQNFIKGFSIIELIVVIVVIGILSTVVIISYNGIKEKAYDNSVLSDIDTLDALETNYGIENNTGGLSYYSGSGASSELSFQPSEGNIIDVQANSIGYCIRGYNIQGTKNSIYNALTKESSPGACNATEEFSTLPILSPSSEAIANSPSYPIGQALSWIKLDTGDSNSCAIASNYRAYCWGRNDMGQLGDGTTSDKHIPTPVYVGTEGSPGALYNKSIIDISSNEYHSCVLTSDNKAYCWGYGEQGQMGNGTNTVTNSAPVAVTTSSGVLSGKTLKSISVGGYYTCVVAWDSTNGNKTYCWGANWQGQLGNGNTSNSNTPVAVSQGALPTGATIKSLSAGNYHACIVASNSKAYCWGYNDGDPGLDGYPVGSLGNGGSGSYSSTPVAVLQGDLPSDMIIKSISAGFYHTCAIASDNKAYCWGFNSYGQIGDGTTTKNPLPQKVVDSGVLSSKTLEYINSGYDVSCAIDSGGAAYCWGLNMNAALGTGSSSPANSAVPLAVTTSGNLAGKTIISIMPSEENVSPYGYFNCALASDSNIYCWGINNKYELGDNTSTTRLSPASIYTTYP